MADPSQMSMNEWMASGIADAAVADAFQQFLMTLGFTGDIPVRATDAAVQERALRFIRERDEARSTKRERELCSTLITMMDRWAIPTDALWEQYRAGTIEVRPLLLEMTSRVNALIQRDGTLEDELALVRRDRADLQEKSMARVAELEAEIAALKGQRS